MLLESGANLIPNSYYYSEYNTYEERCTYILNEDYKDYNINNTSNYSNLEIMSEDESDEELKAFRQNLVYPEFVEDWSSSNILKWITDLYINEDINYESANLHLLKDSFGSDLINYPPCIFQKIDALHGMWLYNKVRELIKSSGKSKLFEQIETQTLAISNNEANSTTDDVSNSLVVHRKRGRPRTTNRIRRKSEHKTGKLWEFIRDMLLNPKYCPSIIRWENHDEGTFRFVCSDRVAKIWGSKRGNNCMNYEKLSRAMRYYYRGNILQPVLGKRLVYKFGPNAKGWKTENPNFLRNENNI